MTPAALATLLADRDPAALPLALRELARDDPAATALEGEMLRRSGQNAVARDKLEAALDAFPDVLPLYHLAALACAASDATFRACAHWEALLERAPATSGAWFNLGQARSVLGHVDGALAALAEAARLAPNDSRPLMRAAALHAERAALPEAIELLSRAIALAPATPHAWFARAAHRSSLALHADAVADLSEAVRLQPGNAAGHSALLLELHYDNATLPRGGLRALHEEWNARHASLPRIAPAGRRAAGARLRIAYLSPRFAEPPLEALFVPVLEAHDRSRFEVICYAAHPASGPTAERICNAVDLWRNLPDDDDAAAKLVAGDDCDLLVDLAGHAPGNRLPMLARKPARLIATWLDYFDTTGVASVDYLVGDPVHTPPGEADRFSERLALLPRARFVYRAPVAIAVAPAPCRQKGHITFGSFNRHAKLTDDVADCWRDVLAAVPGARLALRASAYRSRSSVEWIRKRWAARGVPVDRVDFAPFVSLDALHAAYAGIDVALDPFPFNGGVTTCDALAHGVPVVTMHGDSMVARQGAALLSAVGHPEWIAASRNDYVRIASDLADAHAQDGERRRLAAAFAASPLASVAVFTRDLEALYEAMIVAGPGGGPPLVAP